jgi:hypothetical protein
MGDQEESGVDDHTSNRNQSAATARSRGWQSGGGLGPHRLHQHHRGHREAGAQAHRGKIHTSAQQSFSSSLTHCVQVRAFYIRLPQTMEMQIQQDRFPAAAVAVRYYISPLTPCRRHLGVFVYHLLRLILRIVPPHHWR